MEMTPFLILRKTLLGVAKLGDKCQIWCLCQIVAKLTLNFISKLHFKISYTKQNFHNFKQFQNSFSAHHQIQI